MLLNLSCGWKWQSYSFLGACNFVVVGKDLCTIRTPIIENGLEDTSRIIWSSHFWKSTWENTVNSSVFGMLVVPQAKIKLCDNIQLAVWVHFMTKRTLSWYGLNETKDTSLWSQLASSQQPEADASHSSRCAVMAELVWFLLEPHWQKTVMRGEGIVSVC